MSVQILFCNDMIINTPFIAEWEYIRRLKQDIIDKISKIKVKISNNTVI